MRTVRDRRTYCLGGAAALAIALAAHPPAALAQADPVAPPSGPQLVRDLRAVFGQHHARAAHAKGVVLQGMFTPTAEAASLCAAKAFTSGAVPVTVRFSDGAGIPEIPDTDPAASPRGLAIKLRFADGSTLDVATHSFNGFPVATASEFDVLLRAIAESGPGAAQPTALDRFLATHQAAKTFLTQQKPPPVSYATTAYFGVNAFSFLDGHGGRTFIRYRLVPEAGEHQLDAGAVRSMQPDYLAAEIASRVAERPIQFDWLAQIAAPGDKIDDPSQPWPEDRRLVKLGTVTVERMAADQAEAGKRLLFLPATLPPGIETADPMLAARNAAYPVSFAQRQ